jgi:hypothetical protein
MKGVLLLSFLIAELIVAADPCVDWFRESGLKPGPQCLVKCATLSVGMATFSCPQRCKEFCGKPSPCAALGTKLKDGRPKGWIPKIEKTKKWTPEERQRAIRALSSLPEELQVYVKGFYRMDASFLGDNPGEQKKGNIALYDSAFGDKYVLPQVMAHELSHSLYDRLLKKDRASFLDAADWRKSSRGNQNRVGRPKETFIKPHGMDSPSEDFSIDIEYYLFDPERLKKVTPRVYDWIQTNYGSWLRLNQSEVCGEGT